MLGFRDLVRSGQWQPTRILSALEKVKRISKPYYESMRSTNFSDCIVISAPADEMGFLTITQSAFFLAIELVHNKVLLRGGIDRGELYHDGGHVFGPALIDAYELECKMAQTPRIILASNLFEQARWLEPVSESQIEWYGKVSVPVDANDGYRYIDYFSHEHMGSFDAGYDGLLAHHSTLEAMVGSHICSPDARIRTKYEWVKDRLDEARAAMKSGQSTAE